jgi:gluconokinase
MLVLAAGVAGSGKTTVGQLLAARQGWIFADGDSFHPAANIAKTRSGVPLTGEDRRPWLAAITSWMDELTVSGLSAVLACSGLKRRYRDELLDHRPATVIIFLNIARDQGKARVRSREGHFAAEDLLASQFAALEPPVPEEQRVYPVSTTSLPPGQVVTEIVKVLGLPSGR